jgi:hypothetical protein
MAVTTGAPGSIANETLASFQALLQSHGVDPQAVAAQFASAGPGLDRLVRKEDALGTIREILPPTDQKILQAFPFLDVATDDVVFDYVKGFLVDGMSPARAEDAEAELSQKDDLGVGQGRASIIDWAEKDKYTASDVTRWREANRLAQIADGLGVQLSLGNPGNQVAEFNARVARDDARRTRKLLNRIEWMGQTALWTGALAYNDGRIQFSVNYGRPAGQQDVLPAGPLWDAGTAHDPIGDLLALDAQFYTTYGVHLRTAWTSKKVLNTIWKSSRWIANFGIVVGGTPSSPIDMNYVASSWNPQVAIDAVEAATGIRFEVYDSVYRSRAIGSSTITNTRFSPENKILFFPDEAQLGEINDTDLGFGRVLTAPHPEGNFQSGFYEWEKETIDPWMTVRGTGIKAFPVFPMMEYSTVMRVLA